MAVDRNVYKSLLHPHSSHTLLPSLLRSPFLSLTFLYRLFSTTRNIMDLTTRSNPLTSTPTSPYPTVFQIEEMFTNRLVARIFNNYYADPVDITVIGQDFHLSGHYNSIQRFDDEVFAELWELVKVDTVRTEVLRVIGGGESAWAAVETRVTATTKYGELRIN